MNRILIYQIFSQSEAMWLLAAVWIYISAVSYSVFINENEGWKVYVLYAEKAYGILILYGNIQIIQHD